MSFVFIKVLNSQSAGYDICTATEIRNLSKIHKDLYRKLEKGPFIGQMKNLIKSDSIDRRSLSPNITKTLEY